MARIIYGPIITDIKGSIGGMTFQKNGSGTIARLKPRKTKTNTQKQRDQQPRLKQVQAAWNLLTLVNKVLWNDFAAANKKIGLDGQEKKLTGYQWFLSINENRLLSCDNILESPPIYEIVNPIASIFFSFDGLRLKINSNVSVDATIFRTFLNVSFLVNSASRFDFAKNRLINIRCLSDNIAFTIANPTNDSFWNNYYNSQFPPNIGNKSFYVLGYIKYISAASGISSLAYTTIAKFVWDGTKYVIE